MNLVYGKVIELFQRDGLRCGKVRVGGVCKAVTLELVADADIGDEVLFCDGIAIGKVRDCAPPENYVSSNPR